MSYLPNNGDAFDLEPAPRRAPALSIVVPCHDEEAALPALFRRLERLSDDLSARGLIRGPLRLVLVDDGSRDATWSAIEAARTTLPGTGLKLSRNHGHQAALLAGLGAAPGDAVVSMDADLQDDPDAVIGMVEAYRDGAEIVYGVRACRASDTAFKRGSARTYYRLLEALGVDVLPDHADFRLMSRRALDALARYEESNLFLRGIVRRLGFETATVTYDPAPRATGQSSYPLGRMVALALDGVTSFSTRPIRLITLSGFVVAAVAILFGLWSLTAWGVGRTVPGWTSIVLPLTLLGGMHMIALGVIGEYVGKIYEEVKRRPRFTIDRTVQTADTAQVADAAERRAGVEAAGQPNQADSASA